MGKWSSRFQRIGPVGLLRSAKVALDQEAIIAAWAQQGRIKENWGDLLNPTLIEAISGRKPVNRADVINLANHPIYYVIGSGLGNITSKNAVVWGMGFRTEDAKPLVQPREIRAVRGPLSRQKYLDAGIECPAVYGDPALLFPRFFHPEVEAQYTLGVIPHISEQTVPAVARLGEEDGVKFIDVTAGIEQFIRDILSCEVIASSSLHGLIAADAYGVPSTWISLTEKPDEWYFKFRDYMKSVGRPEMRPFPVGVAVSISELLDQAWRGTATMDLEALMDACPF